MKTRVHCFASSDALMNHCLDSFRQIFPKLSHAQGLMLSGGRTPLEIYRRAAVEGLSTRGILFLSDERYVPVTDPQSNFGTISPSFKTSSFLPIHTERSIEDAAQAFHHDLSQIQTIPFGLLGIGADGHTASLFNLKDAALRDDRLAIPVPLNLPGSVNRISVTPNLLHRVEKLVILATGEDKKEIIQTLLNHPQTIPTGVALDGHPNLELWTDQAI